MEEDGGDSEERISMEKVEVEGIGKVVKWNRYVLVLYSQTQD